MAKAMFEVDCPCCQAILKIDPETCAVIAHTVPEKPKLIEDLATELDVSSRHLRRAIAEHYGVSPVELAQTQRLLTAKQMLTDTNLPIGEIAFASGFAAFGCGLVRVDMRAK